MRSKLKSNPRNFHPCRIKTEIKSKELSTFRSFNCGIKTEIKSFISLFMKFVFKTSEVNKVLFCFLRYFSCL